MSARGATTKPNARVHMTHQLYWAGHGIWKSGTSDVDAGSRGHWKMTLPTTEVSPGTYEGRWQIYIDGVAQPTISAACYAGP
jgi:hypothetical protein